MSSNCFKSAILIPRCYQLQLIRNVKRINIQKPRPPHFERDKMLEACKPIYPKKPPYACSKAIDDVREEDKVLNPFQTILAKEARNWFEHSKFIGFLHSNPIKADETLKMFILLKREGITMRHYGKAIITEALEGTKYESALKIYQSRNVLLFSDNSNCVAALFKVMKKTNKLFLMAGILEDRFMTYAQLERYAKLPDINIARAQFVSLLNSPAMTLHSQLNTHQQNLVLNLEERIKQLSPPSTEQSS